ncbi:hypothetical protein ABER75_11135 [Niallia taxi]|uniref:hypothetical protein n=1 Tax=Niallia taxi TaxID=2499688 RepID=UPI003D2788A6
MKQQVIRVNEHILIDYVFDNLLTVQDQIISEFQYSQKVVTGEHLTVGILFERNKCKIFYYDIPNQVLNKVYTKSYSEFISDSIINKFKTLYLPEYMERFQKYRNEKVRELLADFFLLGKFEVKLNSQLDEIECCWKKAKLSFLLNPQENEIYDIVTN